MSLFKKKRSSEVIDFTNLQRRKIIKPQVKEETIDLFGNSQSSNSSIAPSSSVASNNGSSGASNDSIPGFDFLSNLASAGNSNETSNVHSPGPVTSSLRAARRERLRDEVGELRIKLDDTDYKLNELVEKVKLLESKLNNLER